MNNIYRHGDLFIRAAELPKEAKKLEEKKSHVLAYGETTGHKHLLTAERGSSVLIYEEKGRAFFSVEKDAKLSHEEHGTLVINPGTYEVVHEREHDWFKNATRKVVD